MVSDAEMRRREISICFLHVVEDGLYFCNPKLAVENVCSIVRLGLMINVFKPTRTPVLFISIVAKTLNSTPNIDMPK